MTLTSDLVTPGDLAHWRAEYPILATSCYLSCHSLGAVPRQTAHELARYHAEWATLGISAWEGPWWRAFEDFSADLERLLDAARGTVVPMQNATQGMAAVASCFDWSGPRNGIVMTDGEFTTSYPFWRGVERLGARITIVPSRDKVDVPPADFARAIDASTALVATSHVYFRSGAVADLGRIAALAHAQGALVLGDGYQAVGAVPTSVRALDLDFYVAGCHKYLSGGAGAGFLYVRPELAQTLEPRLTGWFGLADPFAYEPRLDGGPRHTGIRRFLNGTPNIPGIYAARAGLANVLAAGMPAIRAASLALTDVLFDGARARGFAVKTPRDPARRGGMVCLDFPGAEAACRALVERGVIVDYRPDCGLRVSPHFYSTAGDLERFFATLDQVRR